MAITAFVVWSSLVFISLACLPKNKISNNICFYIISKFSMSLIIDPFGPGGTKYSIIGLSAKFFSSMYFTASFSMMPNMPNILLYFFVLISIYMTVAIYWSLIFRNISGWIKVAIWYGVKLRLRYLGNLWQTTLNIYWSSMRVWLLATHCRYVRIGI